MAVTVTSRILLLYFHHTYKIITYQVESMWLNYSLYDDILEFPI